jgi:threonine aldolase
MRNIISEARVGDSFYGEDPSVNELESFTAKLFGHEAAIFVPSGTMSNQIAVQLHCRSGESVICAPDLHIIRAESGGLSALAGVQHVSPRIEQGFVLCEQSLDNTFVGRDSLVTPSTTLMVLENTHLWSGGKIHPMQHMKTLSSWCKKNEVSLHLDGARLWHAHVETGIPLVEFAALFDSLSVCFSKGLGAPAGSCLISSGQNIKKAQMLRKRLGGTMRQAGHLAAAAHWALVNNLSRLKDDHIMAKRLARWFQAHLPEAKIEEPETNIVLLRFKSPVQNKIDELFSKYSIRLSALNSHTLRAVCHKDIPAEQFNCLVAEV